MATLCALTAIAAAFFSSAKSAIAQSALVMYGVVDTGVRYVEGTSSTTRISTWSVTPGGAAQSLIGLHGQENLGQGAKAYLRLENRFFGHSGALDPSHPYFSTALLGMESDRFGRLTLGRQTNPQADAAVRAFASNPWLPTFYLFRPEATMAAGAWTDNMLKYTAGVANLTFQASQAFGNQPGHMSYGSQSSMSLTYAIDRSFALAAAYLLTRDSTNGSPAKTWTYGGSYWLGMTRLHLGVAVNRFSQGFRSFGRYSEASLAALGMLDLSARTMYFAGVTQIVGRAHLSANFWRTLQDGDMPSKNGNATQLQLVANLSLSKGTALYGEVDYARYSGGLIGAQLQGDTTVMPPVTRQLGAMAGIRHRF
ncbi:MULTISPECIES: porin [Pandoraea]|nr:MULTISPECIES: porin [Pandoraea]